MLIGYPLYVIKKITDRVKAFLDEDQNTENSQEFLGQGIDEDDVSIKQMFKEVQETKPSSTDEYLKTLGKSNLSNFI